MAFFKTVLVLLLALLLPIKGAVAAMGMACAQPTHHQEQTLAAAEHHHGMQLSVQPHADAVVDAHVAGHAHDVRTARDGESHIELVQIDKGCSVCAACSASSASLPPSRAEVPLFAAPSGKACVPAALAYPSHVSAGLERPPRSI